MGRALMTQNEIELILMRQLASYLAIPVFLVGAEGGLLFYNEAAGRLLGHAYQESGDMVVQEWSAIFKPTQEDGERVPPDKLPLLVALRERRLAYMAPLYIVGLDNVQRKIAVTAFPLEGQQGRHLGAVAIFSEVTD